LFRRELKGGERRASDAAKSADPSSGQKGSRDGELSSAISVSRKEKKGRGGKD